MSMTATRVTARRALGSLDDALEWWCGRLSDVMPSRLHKLFASPPPRVALLLDEDGVTYAQLKAGQYVAQVRDPWQWDQDQNLRLPKSVVRKLKPRERVLLRVAPAITLTHQMTLPLGAQTHLASAMAMQLDRYFPLKLELLYTDYRVIHRDTGSGHLSIEIAAIRRAHLDAMVEAAEFAGSIPSGAEIDTSGDTGSAHVNFMRVQNRLKNRRVRRLNLLLVATLFVALIGAQQILEVARARELAALNNAIASLSLQEEQARATSRELAALRNEMELTRVSHSGVGVLAILDDLSRRVPKDAWLNAFEFSRSKGEVNVSGLGRDATVLMSELSKSSILQALALRGAVTKDGKGFERFNLTAKIEGGAGL